MRNNRENRGIKQSIEEIIPYLYSFALIENVSRKFNTNSFIAIIINIQIFFINAAVKFYK